MGLKQWNSSLLFINVGQIYGLYTLTADHYLVPHIRLVFEKLVFEKEFCIQVLKYISHLVGKPTMWFPNRFDTNRAVQAQKLAEGLKFRI